MSKDTIKKIAIGLVLGASAALAYHWYKPNPVPPVHKDEGDNGNRMAQNITAEKNKA